MLYIDYPYNTEHILCLTHVRTWHVVRMFGVVLLESLPKGLHAILNGFCGIARACPTIHTTQTQQKITHLLWVCYQIHAKHFYY